ncbi:MAG: DUF4416 family protein, partial [Planctomycetota bacterium]
LYNESFSKEAILKKLSGVWGAIDAVSDSWPFTFTSYYEKEMGVTIFRCFVTFQVLKDPAELMIWKGRSNELEKEFETLEWSRPVNLDPGYFDLGKVILASTKDHAHRVYLGQGIFGEVTLYAKKGAWASWPWTYPDYLDPRYHHFFWDKREEYAQELKVFWRESKSM